MGIWAVCLALGVVPRLCRCDAGYSGAVLGGFGVGLSLVQ